jgi:hypothetical protein
VKGSLSVLNVGAGDIKVTFNHLDSAEAKKAITMLLDMQVRGYAILVETEDGYRRALTIDASRGRYVIQIPQDAPLPADAEEVSAPAPAATGLDDGSTKKNGRRGRRVSVPVAGRRAYGVARSAGG